MRARDGEAEDPVFGLRVVCSEQKARVVVGERKS